MLKSIIIHYGALGDTLCSWPVLLALDAASAGREKYFLGNEALAFLLRPLGFTPCPAPLAAQERAFYDPAVKLDSDTTLFRFCLGKVPEIIPPGACAFRSLPEEEMHVSEALAARAVELGLTVPGMAGASSRFQALRGGWQGENSRKIALFPGGGHKMKQWPPSHFIALAKTIARAGYEPVQIIGPTEKERGPDLRTAAPHPTGPHVTAAPRSPLPDLATAVPENLEELLALLTGMRLIIGNDSGPMHLAALAGAPTLALFGPTSPRRWRPMGPRAAYLAPDHLPCAPCSAKADGFGCLEPTEPLCLATITPALVWKKALAMLCPCLPAEKHLPRRLQDFTRSNKN